MPEPITLADAKAYIRVTSADEDAKITAMIPRARLWVEAHTGLALDRRQFVERHHPRFGAIRLDKGPLVSVDSVTYLDAGVATAYAPMSYPPSSLLFHPADGDWPSLTGHESFTVTYTAGYLSTAVDERLLGAMYALIEGEFSDGAAYPSEAIAKAERCCGYLRTMVA